MFAQFGIVLTFPGMLDRILTWFYLLFYSEFEVIWFLVDGDEIV